MYVIGKTFGFAAAHHLPLLAEGHKCRRVHGHNYTVTVELSSTRLDPTGFVVDYANLSPFGDWVKDTLDHQDLNQVMPSGLPSTAENLAEWLYTKAVQLLTLDNDDLVTAVRVCETANTVAEYRP